jgi:multidrug transporter EmrE-like cation transporter
MSTYQPILPLERTDRRVYGALQALVALLALGYLGFAIHQYVTNGTVVGSDFPFFWVASHIASLHDLQLAYTGELFSLEAARERWGDTIQGKYWAYPPHFILFLRPLSGLSYGAAFAVWNALSLALFALAVWATFGRSWRPVGFTALAPAALFCLLLGQTGLMMSALLVGGIGWLWRRPVLAGVLLGLLTFKPPLGLLVPFALVAGGHWRAILSASLTAGVLILVSLAIYGLEGWTTYLANLPGRQVNLQEAFGGIIVNLSPTILMAARLLGLEGAIQYGLQALAVAGVLACVMWAFRGGRDPGLCCALLFIGTVLASPFSLSYDMNMVTLAVWLLLQDMLRTGAKTGERAIAALTWSLPLVIYALNEAHIPIGPLVLASVFILVMMRLARGESGSQPAMAFDRGVT